MNKFGNKLQDEPSSKLMKNLMAAISNGKQQQDHHEAAKPPTVLPFNNADHTRSIPRRPMSANATARSSSNRRSRSASGRPRIAVPSDKPSSAIEPDRSARVSKEDLLMEVYELKKRLQEKEGLVQGLRLEQQRLEAEAFKQQRRIEQLLHLAEGIHPTAGTGQGAAGNPAIRREIEKSILARQLKEQTAYLRALLAEKDDELQAMALSTRYGHVQEVENERDVYYAECLRLSGAVQEAGRELARERARRQWHAQLAGDTGDDLRRELARLAQGYSSILANIGQQTGGQGGNNNHPQHRPRPQSASSAGGGSSRHGHGHGHSRHSHRANPQQTDRQPLQPTADNQTAIAAVAEEKDGDRPPQQAPPPLSSSQEAEGGELGGGGGGFITGEQQEFGDLPLLYDEEGEEGGGGGPGGGAIGGQQLEPNLTFQPISASSYLQPYPLPGPSMPSPSPAPSTCTVMQTLPVPTPPRFVVDQPVLLAGSSTVRYRVVEMVVSEAVADRQGNAGPLSYLYRIEGVDHEVDQGVKGRLYQEDQLSAVPPRYTAGDQVEAIYYYPGQTYYPGTIRAVEGWHGVKGAVLYEVQYNDGEREKHVLEGNIRWPLVATADAKAASKAVPPIASPSIAPVAPPNNPRYSTGQRVEARYDGGEAFYPGTIQELAQLTGAASYSYTVLYDDGDRETQVSEDLIRPLPMKEDKEEVKPAIVPAIAPIAAPAPTIAATAPIVVYEVDEVVEVYLPAYQAWFSGRIAARTASPSSSSSFVYRLEYDDGDREEAVNPSRMRRPPPRVAVSSYAIGDRIEAQYRGDTAWFPGSIQAVSDPSQGGGGPVRYSIRYDDGDEERDVAFELIRLVARPAPAAAASNPAPAQHHPHEPHHHVHDRNVTNLDSFLNELSDDDDEPQPPQKNKKQQDLDEENKDKAGEDNYNEDFFD